MSNAPATIWVLYQVMEPLMEYDKSGKLIHALVRSYDVSGNGLINTFHLRE